MELHFAPVQGHTDAAYRHFYNKTYGGDLVFYTPFIRIEKDQIRPKDEKDLLSQLNKGLELVPQIIFRDEKELRKLIEIISGFGFKKIDLNMGCPFPLQTAKGRGAATVENVELADSLPSVITDFPGITFSVKMRLGLNQPDEWKNLLPFLNEIELSHITLHPRTAKQQYSGDIYFDQFGSFLKESKNPVIYNGDVDSPEYFFSIKERYPTIKGIMIGRGALGRPSIFNEIASGKDWQKDKRIETQLNFHRVLFNHYESVLCGDSQVLSKIKPFWEYTENEIGRKAWKAINKAVNLAKYKSALALV